jgi:hypothetical protein
MRGLSASQILDIWERGTERSTSERALAVLARVCPEIAAEDLARLAIGERDALLMEARQATFGCMLNAYAECPYCGEQLEFALDPAEAGFSPGVAAGVAQQGPREFTFREVAFRFRLPDTTDLIAAAQCGSAGQAREVILDRCVLEARSGGVALRREDWPEAAVAELAEHVAQCDPLAELTLNLTCPACVHGWPAAFDIASFFWQEIDTVARRLLREVAGLAHAFGWSQADILSMSGTRRRLYLEMVS